MPSASFQAVSAGRIRVAICGGELLAAAIAAAPSAATDLAVRRGAHPGRHRPRQAFDVGGQRRVVVDMVDGMLADDVDDAGMRLLGVVQIGEAVGEAGPEMQQRRGRRALHAEIAVGSTGYHALEQAEHAAHALHPVQRGNEMHFRSAGIGKQTSTPPATRVRTRLSAPFIVSLPFAISFAAEDQSFLTGFVKGVARHCWYPA